MTRDEAKEAAKVMEAYANGKKIQCNDNHLGNGEWVTTDNPSFNWDKYAYRIKPESKYRHFKNQEECWSEMMKHQPFGWVKEISSEMLYLINGISDMSIVIMEDISSFEEAMNIYEFKDGAPFGIKEE